MVLTERTREELADRFGIAPADVDYWAERVAAELELGWPRLEVELQERYGWAAGDPGKADLFIQALIWCRSPIGGTLLPARRNVSPALGGRPRPAQLTRLQLRAICGQRVPVTILETVGCAMPIDTEICRWVSPAPPFHRAWISATCASVSRA